MIPVLYETTDDGATTRVYYFCCSEHAGALQASGEGGQGAVESLHESEIEDGTVCDYCERPLDLNT